jgi:predicted ATPase
MRSFSHPSRAGYSGLPIQQYIVIVPWRVELLGKLLARRGDETVSHFRTQPTASLFGLLCCRPGRAWSREELIDRFWPDAERAAGQNSLRVSLSFLRRVLETAPGTPGSVFVTTRTQICVRPNAIKTDVAEFHAAIRRGDYALAVQLHDQGPFLPGIYDEWAIEESRNIDALAEDARRQLAAGGKGLLPAPNTFAAASANVPHNLPIAVNRFFGRSGELKHLDALLAEDDTRIISITGPGGTGKTRLSQEAARRAVSKAGENGARFPGGVWFLPLAACRNPETLPEATYDALRAALGIEPSPTVRPLAQIAERVGESPLLLVWDNLEQVADAALTAVVPLLEQLPGAVVLATSRARLGLPGECVLPLHSLPLPAEGEGRTPSVAGPEVTRNPAIALFLDRARAVEADVSQSPRSLEQAAALVTRLEGVPLAIELAAAWANVLTPRQMNERLAARLDSLPARRAYDPPRHASLGATVAWSCDLLSNELRAFFYRLAVFRGGFTAEAAESVCNQIDVHSALSRLRQYSLLSGVPSSDGGSVRFSLPETLREYADDQLLLADREACAERHLHYLQRLAADAKKRQGTPEAEKGLRSLEGEQANIDAVLDHALTVPGQIAAALALASSLSWFWAMRGPFEQSRYRLSALLAAPPAQTPGPARVEALFTLAILAYSQGDCTVAISTVREGLDLCREIGYDEGRGIGLNNLGNSLTETGDLDGAREAFEEALAMYRAIGDPQREATVLSNLGNVAHWDRNLDEANRRHHEALAIRRACGDRRGEGISLVAIAILCNERGEFDQARTHCLDALRVHHAMSDGYRMAHSLETFALAEEGLARPEEAVRLLSAATALRSELGIRLAPLRQAYHEGNVTRLRQQTGEPAFASAWEAGAAIPPHDIAANFFSSLPL